MSKKELKNIFSVIEMIDIPVCLLDSEEKFLCNKAFEELDLSQEVKKLFRKIIAEASPDSSRISKWLDNKKFDLFIIPLCNKARSIGTIIYVTPENKFGEWNLNAAGLVADHQAHEIKTQLATLLMAIKNFEFVAEKHDLCPELSEEFKDLLYTTIKSVNKISRLSEGLITVFKDEADINGVFYIEDLLSRVDAFDKEVREQVTVLQSTEGQCKLQVNKRALLIAFELLVEFLSKNSAGIILDTKNENGVYVLKIRCQNYRGPELDFLSNGRDLSHNELIAIRRLLIINEITCELQDGTDNEKIIKLHFNKIMDDERLDYGKNSIN